jgi:hypothetical protein
MVLSDQTFLIHFSAKNFLNIQRMFIITALCLTVHSIDQGED